MGDAQNPTLVPIGRKRSLTSIRIRTARCSESYSRAHWPKTIVDVNTDSHSPMLRILLQYASAETDRRRQYGFRPFDAQNPIPGPSMFLSPFFFPRCGLSSADWKLLQTIFF